LIDLAEHLDGALEPAQSSEVAPARYCGLPRCGVAMHTPTIAVRPSRCHWADEATLDLLDTRAACTRFPR